MSGPSAWLIDGNNVMGSRPDGWWRDRRAAARRLVGELAGFAAREGVPVTVVFDGAPFEVEVPDDAPLEVAFAARRGRDAGPTGKIGGHDSITGLRIRLE